ncbi:SWF or SNF family helicase [Streptomyces lonarensis]|uniref:SWF or SNF family helicase n=1 Tax=Streptomyces lonarensis TaxID=700599 RepID=A0A7X6HZU5_9ACTN|nr:SWF or SNF family helicase [Streptomyces lonarensis]
MAPLPAPRGRAFTTSWWGRRWVAALEDSALDSARLAAGRRAARRGAVGAVMVRPGRVTAVVSGRDGSAHRADVLLRTFDAAEWRRLLAAVAAEAGRLAALLDGEMPPDLVTDAESAGVELLPGIGDLEPECECGVWDHCEHTAALGYQVGRLLDEDPFLLLLLRGRDERAVAAGLRPQRPGTPRSETAVPAGLDARTAYAGLPQPLPALPAGPSALGAAPALPADTSVEGVDAAGLAYLVAVTARRSARMLELGLAAARGEEGPRGAYGSAADEEAVTALEPVWLDAAAMAAAIVPGEVVARRLAAGASRTPAELARAATAWSAGGAVAVAVLDAGGGQGASWAGPRTAIVAMDTSEAWEDAGGLPPWRRSGVVWTAVGEGAQVRYGPDGRWWPYARRGDRWWPAGGPEPGPAAALAVARPVAAESEPGAAEG